MFKDWVMNGQLLIVNKEKKPGTSNQESEIFNFQFLTSCSNPSIPQSFIPLRDFASLWFENPNHPKSIL